MKTSWAEKVLYAGLILVVMAVFFAIVFQVQALIYTAFALMTAVCIFYSSVQMIDFLQGDIKQKSKAQMWVMIVSVVVTLAVIALSIFVYTGRLFDLY